MHGPRFFREAARCIHTVQVEDILSKQRYIVGRALTEADVRLFMTLIRFDPVYVVYFKTNKKFIQQYPHMAEYVKELYSMPGIKVRLLHQLVGSLWPACRRWLLLAAVCRCIEMCEDSH